MLIKYDPSSIEQLIAGAIMKTHLPDVDLRYEISPLDTRFIMFDLTDVQKGKVLQLALSETKIIDDLHEEDIAQIENIQHQIKRIEGADPTIPLKEQAFIYELFQDALVSIINDASFVIKYFPDESAIEQYNAFLKGTVKPSLTNKIQHFTYNYRKSVLGFHVGRTKQLAVNTINAPLWLTPWLTKFASLSLDNLVVYETFRSGTVYRGRGFNTKGEEDVQYFLHDLQGRIPR